jgi:alpha-glucosidase
MASKLNLSLLTMAVAGALAAACDGTGESTSRPEADAGRDRTIADASDAGALLDARAVDVSVGADSAGETGDSGKGDDARDATALPDSRDSVADHLFSDTAKHDATADRGSDGALPTPVDVDRVCDPDLTLRLTVLDDRAVRLHYVRRGAAQAERGWIFDTARFEGPSSVAIDNAPMRLSVTTAALVIEVSGVTCSIAIRDRAGSVLWRESAPYRADPGGSVALGRGLDDGEHIYGLGEKTGASDRRGRSFEMWNSDPAWSDPTGQYRTVTDPIYQSHPFFLSLRKGGHATGAFLANTHRTTFDVGKTTPDALSMSAALGDVDLFFFDGPSPAAVLERYTQLVGRSFLPPLWALGYHQSRWSYTPAARLEEVAAEFRRRSLPADGLWLDIDYMDGFRDFTWNPTTFADPAGVMARLATSGFKVTAILDPGVKSEPGGSYAVYNEGIAGGHFILGSDQNPVVREVWPGASVFPDYTREATRKWWGDRVGAFAASGVRGLWVDMNEPAVFTKEGFPLDARVDGEGKATTFAEVKNVYALLMARATYEGASRAFPDRRPFVLTRAGFAGVQRYAAVWTGDAQSTWEHLAMTPAMLAGLSVSGVPFVGSDIGGFGGSPVPELYGRWFEVGAFSPFFRSHVATGAPDQEPWSFGPEIEGVARRMLELRYSLLPYWYDAYVTSTRTGAPVVRPLWFEFPADDQAVLHEDEFFVGPSLLVAPVTAANVTTRDVYLPAGRFYEYYTGASYEGPLTVNMPAPLGRVPLFVRAGAVLTTQDVVDHVGAPSNGKKYLDCFPGVVGSMSSVDLYEDDGETTAYATGSYATRKVSSSVTATGLTLDIAAPVGPFQSTVSELVVRVHGMAAAPKQVRVDGATALTSYDLGTRMVTLPALGPAAAHTIVLEYDAVTPPAPRLVHVDLTLTLPAATPAGEIYIGTSALTWKPDALGLTRAGNTASGRLTVLEGTLVKWKATRGTWAAVEVGSTCADLPNRELVAHYGTNGATSVQASIVAWADRCP